MFFKSAQYHRQMSNQYPLLFYFPSNIFEFVFMFLPYWLFYILLLVKVFICIFLSILNNVFLKVFFLNTIFT